MKCSVHRRCAHCRQLFVPDYRNAYHQRFCSEPVCQHASKQTSQRRWLRKPANRNYFRDSENLDRVPDWRRHHPGYWRIGKQGSDAGANAESAQASLTEPKVPPPQPPGTLQDFCRAKAPVFIGLISRLRRCALQEDIARCAIQMVSEAQCILTRCQLRVSIPGRPEIPINFHESG